MSYFDLEWPPIVITTQDAERLRLVAESGMLSRPRVARFLAREISRAEVVPPHRVLRGLVRMGSFVTYRDDADRARAARLVYPHDSDIGPGRVSVLTPVGAALIGLSIGQAIEFRGDAGEKRSLAVLDVHG